MKMEDEELNFITDKTQKNINLDLGDVIKEYMHVHAKTRDKEIISDLLKHTDTLNHEFTMKLVDHYGKITEKAIEIYEKREIQGDKMQKVFGFTRWSTISTNAFGTALSEAKELIRISNPTDNPEVKEILYIRKQNLIMLGKHLSDMLSDNKSTEKLNFKGIGKMLGFNEEEE
ncbi:MAG: hypothetical protein WC614_10875 [bacterium]